MPNLIWPLGKTVNSAKHLDGLLLDLTCILDYIVFGDFLNI